MKRVAAFLFAIATLTWIAQTPVSAQSTWPISSNAARALSLLFDASGYLTSSKLLLTAGALTPSSPVQAQVRTSTQSFSWSNSQIVGLGAALTGDLTICTLPAGTVVNNVYMVVLTQGSGPATLTGAVGRTSAAYIDYIPASSLTAVANTVYGDASGERGTNLTMYDLPSITATTDVKIHFIATVANLDQTVGSTGKIVITSTSIP